MNLGPVTKLDKRTKKMSKKINDNVMPINCVVIFAFPIYNQFVKVTFSLITAFYLTKFKTKIKISLRQLLNS